MNIEITEAWLEKNFRLTWSPVKEMVKPYLLKKRKPVTIHFNKLTEIVGDKKAQFIIKSLLKSKEDKKRFKVQNKGVLYVYCQ